MEFATFETLATTAGFRVRTAEIAPHGGVTIEAHPGVRAQGVMSDNAAWAAENPADADVANATFEDCLEAVLSTGFVVAVDGLGAIRGGWNPYTKQWTLGRIYTMSEIRGHLVRR